MKTKMYLTGTRIERHGRSIVCTLTDMTDSKVEVEMDLSQACNLAHSLLEVHAEAVKETVKPELHPVFRDVLRPWGCA